MPIIHEMKPHVTLPLCSFLCFFFSFSPSNGHVLPDVVRAKYRASCIYSLYTMWYLCTYVSMIYKFIYIYIYMMMMMMMMMMILSSAKWKWLHICVGEAGYSTMKVEAIICDKLKKCKHNKKVSQSHFARISMHVSKWLHMHIAIWSRYICCTDIWKRCTYER
jgi:hypothetical protein